MSTRDKILEIAYRTFAEKGYDRTSMGMIAEEIGITRPALYYHFSSKEDLLLATYETIDPLINISADRVLACRQVDCFREEFSALIASITDNLHDDEQRARFVATVESASGQIHAVTENAQAQYETACEMFGQVLKHGKSIGALSPHLDVEAAKQCLGIYIYGVGDIMLRGCKINLKPTRDMLLDALFAKTDSL